MGVLRRFGSCCLCFTLLPVATAVSQQAAGNGDVGAFVSSCKLLQQKLSARAQLQMVEGGPSDDDYVAAGEACDRLTNAVVNSDPQEVTAAIARLRPALARLGMPPTTPQERFAALEKEASGLSGTALFYQLPELAKRAFNAGDTTQAANYSQQLLQMAPQYPKDWNYGNAIFYGNYVLGLIAMQQGNVEQAGRYLVAAGASPGSPQLDSSGPSMALAKQLLEKAQSDVVLRYLKQCRHFWKNHGLLNEWSAAIRSGNTPSFDGYLNE